MSELLFLGTGAADWHIEDKGEFFRRNSAALVNGNLMLDCGSHIFDFARSINNKELYNNVTDIIITHNHRDHFCKESVTELSRSKKIRLCGDGRVKKAVGENSNIDFVLLEPFKEVRIGEYKVIPLLANHDIVVGEEGCAFHYIIETADEKKIFYGLDGAWFLRPSWEEMKKHKFDVMVFDCTVGDSDDWRLFEHNTIPMLRTMIKEIKAKELVCDNGMLIASHLARTLHLSHEETESILNKIDMITAYDGLKISF